MKYKMIKKDPAWGLASDIGDYFGGYVHAKSKEEGIRKINDLAKIAEKMGIILILKGRIFTNLIND